jgi:hypothetical protein
MAHIGRWQRGISRRARGVAETTERVRQLVDGIENAVSAGDDLELASFLAPPALGYALAETAAMRRAGTTWLPARTGLRWSGSDRVPEGPGRFWLRLRFDDHTQLRSSGRTECAAPLPHEVEVELDTTSIPWRLCQAEEIFSV